MGPFPFPVSRWRHQSPGRGSRNAALSNAQRTAASHRGDRRILGCFVPWNIHDIYHDIIWKHDWNHDWNPLVHDLQIFFPWEFCDSRDIPSFSYTPIPDDMWSLKLAWEFHVRFYFGVLHGFFATPGVILFGNLWEITSSIDDFTSKKPPSVKGFPSNSSTGG